MRDRVLATADWEPQRLERSDALADCDAGRLREESERLLKDLRAFDIGKVVRFDASPSTQNARELKRVLTPMKPAMKAFLGAYDCKENGTLVRRSNDPQFPGTIAAKAIIADRWVHVDDLQAVRRVMWIGRDIQATKGFFEFREGTEVMDTAYHTLGLQLQKGNLDGELESLQSDLQILTSNEESAQLQWRAGARLLLADILGPDWEKNPPTPIRMKAMLEMMDGIIGSLQRLPDVANLPYEERVPRMKAWIERNDMSNWGSKFQGFGEAGIEVDEYSTVVANRGRTLLIAIALRRYYLKYRSCPRSLDDLTKRGFLEVIPKDLTTEKPFEYDRSSCEITSGTPKFGGEVVSASALESKR